MVVTLLAAVAANLPAPTAMAAGLDQKGRADAKEATRLYKQGQYQEAAEIFARLSVDYPDMAIFERNLGACFYYLRKPEPALSNLRHYLSRRKDIAPDDKVAVDRWIDEMEKLRAQNAAASAPPAPAPAEPVAPPPAAAEAPTVTAPPPMAPAEPPKAEEPAPAISAAASIPPAPALSEAPKPAGVDLTSTPAPSDSSEAGTSFYKTWWFWSSAAVVVVGGAVTAIYFATRSHDPCSGASMACLGVK